MWIEIKEDRVEITLSESRPARALWIEMSMISSTALMGMPSRPARALWIEIIWKNT